MYNIEGHAHLCRYIRGFFRPNFLKVPILHTEEIEDTRGKRFLVIGRN